MLHKKWCPLSILTPPPFGNHSFALLLFSHFFIDPLLKIASCNNFHRNRPVSLTAFLFSTAFDTTDLHQTQNSLSHLMRGLRPWSGLRLVSGVELADRDRSNRQVSRHDMANIFINRADKVAF